MQTFVPVEALFKGRHFDGQIIILCVSWYTSFKLSLGLPRYETAWMMLHKLRRAMVKAVREPPHKTGLAIDISTP
jgi:transposase-like protein